MPNYVYSKITVDTDNTELLDKIAEKGLARHYKPMPPLLEGTTSPARIGDNISQEKSDVLIAECVHNNWYSWCNENWGTKWGCFDVEHHDGLLTFTTAWSPLCDELMTMFAKDFPNFQYEWTEEQGFGEETTYVDGTPDDHMSWDIPDSEYHEVDGQEIFELTKPHYKKGKVGFYSDWDFEDYIGSTLEEALETLKQ